MSSICVNSQIQIANDNLEPIVAAHRSGHQAARVRCLSGVRVLFWVACAVLQGGPVSVDLPAMRLKNLVPKLAEITGQKLAVSRELEDEVLLVQVAQMPEDQLLAKVAEVASAEWTPTGDYQKLERSPALKVRLSNQEAALRASFFADCLKGLRATIRKEGPFSAERAKLLADKINDHYRNREPNSETSTNDERVASMQNWDRIMEMTPARAATRQLIADLDPTLYLGLEDGDRCVMDRRANRSQQSLGPLGDRAAQQFYAGQSLWAAEIARRGPRVPPPIRNGWDPYDHAEVITPDRLGVRVTAACYASRDWGYQFMVTFRAPSGTLIHYGNEVLVPELDPAQFVPEAHLDDKTPIAKLDVLKTHSKLRSELMETGAMPSIWREAFLNPEVTEPLAYLVGPEFSALARAESRNVVAYLPDGLAYLPQLVRRDAKTTNGELWRRVVSDGHLRVEDDGRTLTLVPMEPITETRRRASRAALGELLQSWMGADGPSLDSWSRFELTRSTNLRNYLADWLLTLLSGAMSGTREQDPVLMRLYASLTDAQRRQLDRGAQISVDRLSVRQRGYVEALLTRREGGNFMTRRSEGETTTIYRGSAYLDVTDFLPQGVTPAVTLSLSVQKSPTVVTRHRIEGRLYSTVEDLDDFVEKFAVSRQNRQSPESALAAYSDLGVGSRRYMAFHFRLDPETVVRRSLSDSEAPSRFTTFAAMPAEERKTLLNAITKEVQRRKEFDDAAHSRTAPPP